MSVASVTTKVHMDIQWSGLMAEAMLMFVGAGEPVLLLLGELVLPLISPQHWNSGSSVDMGES